MGGGAAAADGFAVPVRPDQLGWRGLFANPKAFGIAAFASIGGVLYGYNQGVFGQVQVMSNFADAYSQVVKNQNQVYRGMFTAILELGAMVGALIGGPVSDVVSRKFSIAGWSVVFMLGTALQAGAPRSNAGFIWAGRWIAGMAVGALSMLVPMYNGELAPPGIRGSLVALQQLAITFGILISYWIAYGTNFIGGTGATQSVAAWRIPLALQLVPALVLCGGCFFLPYSPRWLMLRGREEECLLTLANLRNLPAEDILVQTEYMGLQAERLVQEEEMRERYGTAGGSKIAIKEYGRILTTKTLLHRVALGAAAQALQQWSGINAIIYYAPTIFEQVGLTGSTVPILATGIVGVVNFVMTLPAVLYVDNFGRKPLLFYGALSMAISHAIIGAILSQFENSLPQHKAAGNAAVFFVYWFIASFAVTWGPLAWVVSAEVFPLNVRAKGMSFSSATNWLMNFVVGLVTPVMLQNIRWKTYMVFMTFMIVACIWVWFVLPELKGKSLEEIDAAFDDNAGQLDRERRERVARQIGLDKVIAEAEHKENVSVPGREKSNV